MTGQPCRFCGADLTESFADLGMSPLSNAFIAAERASAMEKFYPLHAFVCSTCRLVQLAAFESPEHIFGDYLYFSSYAESWLAHAAAYAQAMMQRFAICAASQVVEIASNDGYLLQYFQAAGVPVLGIEPAANVAAVAIGKGIPTDVAFFGRATAERLRAAGCRPDLIVANNVLAHVPDLNDFVAGLAILLPEHGRITIEFPHLQRLIDENQFDTIYHEHFSYFSFIVAERIMAHHGLRIFDVEALPTHGGSLRIYARHPGHGDAPVSPAVTALRAAELAAGYDQPAAYRRFAENVVDTKCAILEFLIACRRNGKTVAAYGAPAKGNTLLNYCGVRGDMIRFTVDRSPHKQGMLLPGTHIPIRHPDAIRAERPDYLMILPWNLRDEVIDQMAAIRDWGGRFVVPIPRLQVLP
jgi:2-polyprenyl-3-methyl-5-hydroxy-6-metoxy-1,4-benzoquinol methylase